MYKLFLSLFSLATPLFVFGATTLSNPVPGGGATLEDFILLLLEILQMVLFPVLVLCIIYAGFLLVTAGGDEAQVTKSKTVIMWTLVGGAIIISAKVIQAFISSTVALF